MKTTAASTETQVSEFLAAANVTFSASLVGATKQDEWECDEWRIMLKGARADYSMPYYTGVGHRVDTPQTARQRVQLKGCNRNSIAWHEMLAAMKAKAPSAASVLYALVSDGRAIDQSFSDWADDLGMDSDSRKALRTYEECCETGRKLRVLFTREQRATLEELLRDF